MTPSDLLVACCSLGVRLSSENGKLEVSDPHGVLTDAFKARLKAHEAELETMVRTQPSAEMAAMVQAGGDDAYRHARGSFMHHHDQNQRSSRWKPLLIGGLLLLLLLAGAALIAYFAGAFRSAAIGGPRIP